MKCTIRTMILLSAMYIVAITAAGRLRADDALSMDSSASADSASADSASSASNDCANPRNGQWSFELCTNGAMRHGLNGPAVSPTKVTIGSVVGQTIYQLDVARRTFTTLVAQPQGEADDEVFGPDGTLVWTSLLSGLIRSRQTNGVVTIIGNNSAVSPNGIAFDSNGNAYYSTYPAPGSDHEFGIWKVDPKGRRTQQKVMTISQPMNGFDFSASNEIYGPYPTTGQIVKLNLATQTETVIASGFLDPESVRFSTDKKTLYVLDSGVQAIYSVNIRTGAKTLVVSIPNKVYLDNFRPYGNGFLIADTTSNSPIYYDASTGRQQYVTPVSVFSMPGGISFANGNIYVADFADQKVYNTQNGQLTTVARAGPQPDSAGAAAVSVSFGLFNVAATNKYLAFSCFYDAKVQIRDVNTNRVIVNSIPADPSTTPYTPYGVDFSMDQKTLLIADFGVGLRVNTGPNFQNSRVINVGDNTVVGVAVSGTRQNIVYVSTFSGTLYSVNYVSGSVSVLATGFNGPEGIASIDAQIGDIVMVADVGNQNLVKVYSSNGRKTIVASNLPIGLPGPDNFPPVNVFTGVTADNYGNVYITSDLKDALIKVDGCGRN